MNNFEQFGSNVADKQKGESQTGASGGQADYLDKGLNSAEQRVGGQYYDADKVKGPNKKVTDKIKDKFHSMTGHNGEDGLLSENNDDDDDDETQTAVAQGLSDFDEPRLKRAFFLDRVAELVSNIRNGQHVAASVLVETREKCTVLVAKNNGFKEKYGRFYQKDRLFLKDLEISLKEISRTKSFELSGTKLGLWSKLIDHYQPRLLEWASDIRQNLKRYEDYERNKRSTLSSEEEQPLHDLHRMLRQSGISNKDRSARLVDECHSIRKSHHESVASLRCGSTTVAQNLWQSICFLGRLRSACNDLLEASERLTGSEELEIIPVTLGEKQRTMAPITKSWSLIETFESVGEELSDFSVRRLFGQKLNKAKLLQKFSDQLKRPLQFHVEVQLVLHLIRWMITYSVAALLGIKNLISADFTRVYYYTSTLTSEILTAGGMKALSLRILSKNLAAYPREGGSYFPWFLKHTYLLDSKEPLPENHEQVAFLDWRENAKAHLPREEQDLDLADIQPPARRDAFIAFASLLHSAHPHPESLTWYTLGFCTCSNEWEENLLGGVYATLIGGNKFRVDYDKSLGSKYFGPPPSLTCTFTEFWAAYESGTLI
ncbi:hypothetical protein BJY01DRAFT_243339 [Aspergillus pseudoustus]|uniref:Uncharacterized protein n=1 Tax=Aspergillus pseudoustus TaxID=1810923 RepID=A0ABR4KSY1_9EURO